MDLHKPDAPYGKDENGAPKLYKHQEFPALVYKHPKNQHKVVQNQDELEEALKKGYALKPAPPETEAVEEAEPPKKGKK